MAFASSWAAMCHAERSEASPRRARRPTLTPPCHRGRVLVSTSTPLNSRCSRRPRCRTPFTRRAEALDFGGSFDDMPYSGQLFGVTAAVLCQLDVVAASHIARAVVTIGGDFV